VQWDQVAKKTGGFRAELGPPWPDMCWGGSRRRGPPLPLKGKGPGPGWAGRNLHLDATKHIGKIQRVQKRTDPSRSRAVQGGGGGGGEDPDWHAKAMS
jgi:hypothetical protein